MSPNSDQNSLEIAQRYAALIDRPPSSFLSLTRGLLLDHSKGHTTPISRTAFLLRRLAKGPSVLSPLYHAVLSLREISDEDGQAMSFRDVLAQFANDELAALISVIYFVARAKAMSEKDEWPFISSHLEKSLNIGWRIGESIKKIGPAYGLLTGGFPIIGLATFLKHDKPGFKEYRRSLKSNARWLDHKYELKKWGCTCFQIGATFVQQSGFGIPVAEAFSAIDGRENFDTMDISESFLKVWTTAWWLRGLYEKSRAPKPHPVQEESNYLPGEEGLPELLRQALRYKDASGEFNWAEKPKDSISPRTHPKLFGISKAAVAAPVAAPQESQDDAAAIPYESLPVHIKEILSQEEWEGLGADEAAQLMKEMGGEPTE